MANLIKDGIYNLFISGSPNFKKTIWYALNTFEQYIFLKELITNNEIETIAYLMRNDFISFQQHLFLVELNHDLKKEIEFIDHDMAIQLFKDRILTDFYFLSDKFIMSYVSESRDILNIKRSQHYHKLIPILLKIYKKYEKKFLPRHQKPVFDHTYVCMYVCMYCIVCMYVYT
jgi:hypothetical protein